MDMANRIGNLNKGSRHKTIFSKHLGEIKDENSLNPKTNSGVIGSCQKQSLPSKIQTKGRSDMHLWERTPDDGPHPIQLHKDKRAKRHTQMPNKQTDQITG
jgi:hypothetical protein